MTDEPTPASNAGTTTHDRKELFDLYKIAVDEYRFNVTLNSSRTHYFFALNLAVLAGAVGLLAAHRAFAGLVFLGGMLTSSLAASAIAKGHEYYQRAREQKTAIEALLGLDRIEGPVGAGVDIRLATTAGMREGPRGRRPDAVIRPGTIVHKTIWILRALSLLNVAGIVYAWLPQIVAAALWACVIV